MTAIRHSLFVLGATLLAVLPLGASSVIPVDFARLSQLAHRVIGGRITEVTASRDANDGYIYSNVKVLVSRSNPGEWVGREYTFRMIGGELDGKSLHIADFPRMQVDDSVVLFLNDQPASVFGPTVGLWQGVFFVESDGAGVETVTDHQRQPVLGVREKQLLRGVRRTERNPLSPARTAALKRWGSTTSSSRSKPTAAPPSAASPQQLQIRLPFPQGLTLGRSEGCRPPC